MLRIALVEDNRPLADGIAKAFQAEGHGVEQFHDGEDALWFLTRDQVDLIILDINLPNRSGLEILTSLRSGNLQTPVLLLTARDRLTDKIDGLDLGADDYLTKPFDLDELKARARALLRRSEKQIAEKILVGGIEYDPVARLLKVGGTVQELPRREHALAETLILAKDRIISKAQILDHLYGSDAEVDENAVEIYIHRLRKRLIGSGTEIKTARGLGYCFRELK